MIAAGGDRWYEIREEKRTATLNILTHSMGYALRVYGGRAQYIVYVRGDVWVPGVLFHVEFGKEMVEMGRGNGE